MEGSVRRREKLVKSVKVSGIKIADDFSAIRLGMYRLGLDMNYGEDQDEFPPEPYEPVEDEDEDEDDCVGYLDSILARRSSIKTVNIKTAKRRSK